MQRFALLAVALMAAAALGADAQRVVCDAGQYPNARGVCTACRTGFTTAGSGATSSSSCRICAPGYGGARCTACPAGTWSAGGSAASPTPACTACAAGSTTPAKASTLAAACSRCLPGFAGADCGRCTRGTYSAGGAKTSSSCTSCPTGLTTAATGAIGASACNWCAAGFAGPRCSVCAIGTWSAGGTASTPKPQACTTCPRDKTTASTGSTSRGECSLTRPCDAGKGGAFCATCGLGFYSAGGDSSVPRPACSACPAGYTTAAKGAGAAGDCSVAICAAGSGGPGCGACAAGTYSTGGSILRPQPDCVACPIGQTTLAAGATSKDACVAAPCNPGEGGAACELCAVGSYSYGGNSSTPYPACISCAAGYTTDALGATSIDDCAVNPCDEGTGGDSCDVCAVGTYSAGGTDADPLRACQSCDTGFTTVAPGALSAGDCVPDYCPPGRGGSGCEVCEVGYFSVEGTDVLPRPACAQCPSGWTTADVGAASDADCSVPAPASG